MYDPKSVIADQLKFYERGGAGCLFASAASKKPAKYGWELRAFLPQEGEARIEEQVQSVILDPNVNTASLIFPTVHSPKTLIELVYGLAESTRFQIEQDRLFNNLRCLGLRARIGEGLKSWVTGFGPFEFLPLTRQAPYTEITLRTKQRPDYEWVMKESPDGVVHLADMDMQGIGRPAFEKLWNGSLQKTKRVLGHKPDLASAAKTTFAIPNALISEFKPLPTTVSKEVERV